MVGSRARGDEWWGRARGGGAAAATAAAAARHREGGSEPRTEKQLSPLPPLLLTLACHPSLRGLLFLNSPEGALSLSLSLSAI